MSSTFKLTHPNADPRATLSFVLTGIVFGIGRIVRALKNRRDATMLAELDGRMLADIGLTRSDLRDAYAEPLWRDPTDILARRARDRRRYPPHAPVPVGQLASPQIAPETSFAQPNWRKRYTL
jgi:uncharacterized protein YjiS (DUF1127 family)